VSHALRYWRSRASSLTMLKHITTDLRAGSGKNIRMCARSAALSCRPIAWSRHAYRDDREPFQRVFTDARWSKLGAALVADLHRPVRRRRDLNRDAASGLFATNPKQRVGLRLRFRLDGWLRVGLGIFAAGETEQRQQHGQNAETERGWHGTEDSADQRSERRLPSKTLASTLPGMTSLSPSAIVAERAAPRGSTIEDLDRDAIRAYLETRDLAADTDDQQLIGMVRTGLATRSGSQLAPTSVGLLCFGHTPQLLQPHWGVSCVRVHGTTMADPIQSSTILEGPLPRLLEAALAFVQQPGSAWPHDVVREAIINALVHRDLKNTARVSVQHFADRLVIRSPGGLPNGVPRLDAMSLEGGESIPRNPLLASTARLLGMGDQIGRGLALIRAQTGDRPPTRIVTTPSEVRLILAANSPH
jgi:hypothetical protein